MLCSDYAPGAVAPYRVSSRVLRRHMQVAQQRCSPVRTPSQDKVISAPMHAVRGCLQQPETLLPGLYDNCSSRSTSLGEAHESVRLSRLLKGRACGIWLMRCHISHSAASPSFTQAPSHRVFGRSRLCLCFQQKLPLSW